MTEDMQDERIDRLLSIIKKQQEQVAKLPELVETTLARQRSYLDEARGNTSAEPS